MDLSKVFAMMFHRKNMNVMEVHLPDEWGRCVSGLTTMAKKEDTTMA